MRLLWRRCFDRSNDVCFADARTCVSLKLLLGPLWLTEAGFLGFVGAKLWAAFQARRLFRRRDKERRNLTVAPLPLFSGRNPGVSEVQLFGA